MEPFTLRCLMGQPAPADLGAALASFLRLPAAVQDSYAEVLAVHLGPVVDDRAETLVKRYCRRHEIEPDQLSPSVQAFRFLFTHAVKAGADRGALVADVTALLPEEQASLLLDRLLPLFDAAFPRMRQAAVFQSVADHGRVVRAVRWRMDVMQASNHGRKLDMPVATLTLQYQEGPTAGQMSYQLLPEQAVELRRALTEILDGL